MNKHDLGRVSIWLLSSLCCAPVLHATAIEGSTLTTIAALSKTASITPTLSTASIAAVSTSAQSSSAATSALASPIPSNLVATSPLSTAKTTALLTAKTSQKITPNRVDKPSLMEQALDQQKHNNAQQTHLNELDFLHGIPLASSPTQRFFAAQHQQFSRWVQAILNHSGS